MVNVTVLKDEYGVLREYREVKRMANVGERIKITRSENNGRYFCDGDVGKVSKYDCDGGMVVDFGAKGEWCVMPVGGSDFVVLEPTSTVIIDGVRYTEEKRKAVVGERILITKRDPDEVLYDNGDVFIVARLDYDGDVRVDGDYFDNAYVTDDEYTVLTPISNEPKTETSTTPAVYNVTINVTVNGTVDDAIRAVEKQMREALAKVKPPTAGEIIREIKPPAKSPQQLRDEIVERAKRDVAELVAKSTFIYSADEWFTPNTDEATYVVNREKRTVVALIQRKHSGKVWAKGIAKCAPGDVFNSHIGRAIALRRALGLPVPDEYLNAPQPTEVRVGDVVRKVGGVVAEGITGVYVRKHEGGVLVNSVEKNPGRKDGYYWAYLSDVKVIDDSREETEVSR